MLLTTLLSALLLASAPVPSSPRVETPHFRIYGPDTVARSIARVAEDAERRFGRVCRMIDACDALAGEKIDVYVAEDPEAFAQAFPHGSPLAEWAVGVAFPAERRMVLRAHGSQYFSLLETFDHEISHVLVHARAGGRRLPRWFLEGVAIWQEGEALMNRFEQAQRAALTSSLIPFDELDRGFPPSGPLVGLAYAQSALFVRWLVGRSGAGTVTLLIAKVREGVSFEGAFHEVYQEPFVDLAAEWKATLEASASPLVLLRDGNILWIAMALLFVWVAMVKMRDRRAAIEMMGEDEAVEEAWDDLQIDRSDGSPPTLH